MDLYGPILHPYMTTGKTVTLTVQTFVGKVMSLLFNMLSRFVIAFLPKSKSLLISLLSEMILAAKKIKHNTPPPLTFFFILDRFPHSNYLSGQYALYLEVGQSSIYSPQNMGEFLI